MFEPMRTQNMRLIRLSSDLQQKIFVENAKAA